MSKNILINNGSPAKLIGTNFSSHLETGQSKPEVNGKNRAHAQDIEVTEDIQHYIESLVVYKNHYSRNSTTKQYLSPELSIAKMWRLWKKIRRGKTSRLLLCQSINIFSMITTILDLGILKRMSVLDVSFWNIA